MTDDEGGRFAVRGDESHEHDDVLSPDERGEEQHSGDVPPPSEPKGPAPG